MNMNKIKKKKKNKKKLTLESSLSRGGQGESLGLSSLPTHKSYFTQNKAIKFSQQLPYFEFLRWQQSHLTMTI